MLLNKVNRHIARHGRLAATFEGVYRASRIHWHRDTLLGPCRRLELHDSSGSITALLPGDECKPWLVSDAPYRVRVAPLDHLPQPTVRVASISETAVRDFNPLLLLPAPWTEKPRFIPRLLALYTELRSGTIARFWQDVFRNELWVRGFLSQSASRDCHHSGPGELLAHSVTVAESVSALLKLQRGLGDAERDAAITVALLHDATKVAWSRENRNRWKVPFLFREHERLLPYFLSEPLLELGRLDTNSHSTLVRLIDDYTRPGERANSPLSSIIREVDRLDSHLDARDRARRIQGYRANWIKICGRMHWSATE